MYKSLFFLIVLIFSGKSYGQKIQIEILDKKDKTPLSDVLLYADEKVVGKSGKDGIIKFNDNHYTNVAVVKEDYYDTIISIATYANRKLYLKKIEAIDLKEVVVYKKSVKNILDSVYENSIHLKKINTPSFLHFFNVLNTAGDTLVYINDRLNLVKGKGYHVEKDQDIIANFIQKDNRTIFFLNGHDIVFNKNLTHSNSPVNSFELMLVAKLSDKFIFSLFEEDQFYKIKFDPKPNNNDYPYSGYIIVDKYDSGVYEFKCELSKHKNKRNLVLGNDILNFHVINETSYIKYSKDADGNYDLVEYAYDSTLQVLNGYFKNKKFTNKCRKEPTPPFDQVRPVLFDVLTYKTK